MRYAFTHHAATHTAGNHHVAGRMPTYKIPFFARYLKWDLRGECATLLIALAVAHFDGLNAGADRAREQSL